jgi:hypothetical protein
MGKCHVYELKKIVGHKETPVIKVIADREAEKDESRLPV